MIHARTKPPTQQRSYGVHIGTIRDGRKVATASVRMPKLIGAEA
jgi:hypothetical protein